jgi:hypothetical protein
MKTTMIAAALLAGLVSLARAGDLPPLGEITTDADHKRCIALGAVLMANSPNEKIVSMAGNFAMGNQLALAAEAGDPSIVSPDYLGKPEIVAIAKAYDGLSAQDFKATVLSDAKTCMASAKKTIEAMSTKAGGDGKTKTP